MEMAKQFTKEFQKLTFITSLDKAQIQSLYNQKRISYTMLNNNSVNLSGKYYKDWVYSGSALKTEQQTNLSSCNRSSHLQQLQLQFNSQLDSASKVKQNQKFLEVYLQDVPFISLIKRSQWEYLLIIMEKSQYQKISLLKQLSCIEFPKLIKLELIGNNIDSIELLQTLQIPNVLELNLNFNKIVNIKSLQKISCLNVQKFSLKANFLNSERTFQGLTRINASNLVQAGLQIQNNNTFIPIIQRHIHTNFFNIGGRHRRNLIQDGEMPHQGQKNQMKYKQNDYEQHNQTYAYFRLRSDYQQELRKQQLIVERMFRDPKKSIIDILNYLIIKFLDSQQYKFLLKTNSLRQEIFSHKGYSQRQYDWENQAFIKYSPYQYLIDYGTDMNVFCEHYQKFIKLKQECLHDYYNRHMKQCAVCQEICQFCSNNLCRCQHIYQQKLHDKVQGKKNISKYNFQ